MNNINNRTLGIGFGPGYEFNLYTKEEVYKPLINLDKLEVVREAILGNNLDSPDLALYMPDLLVDFEITRLAKILPSLLSNLSEESKQLFSDAEILGRLDKRFINTIAKAIPNEHRPQNVDNWSKFLAKEKIASVDPFVLAYIVPAILDLMNDNNLLKVSAEIAKKLNPIKDFRAITLPNYFDIQFSDATNALTLKNNGRSLIFKPNEGKKTTALFRNKIWELDHTHIHLERDGEEREFKFYQTRVEHKATLDTPSDPNLKIVGEVHSVFKRVSGKGDVKFMAIGIPMKVGEENSQFQRILDSLNIKQMSAAEGLEIPTEITFRDVFMKDFSSADMIYHSWGSLQSSTHAFKAGLRFNISEIPMLVSMRQYDALKVLFGDIQPIDPEKALYPIDRKADHRKIRQLKT